MAMSMDCELLEKFFEDSNTPKEFGANPISEFIPLLQHFQSSEAPGCC